MNKNRLLVLLFLIASLFSGCGDSPDESNFYILIGLKAAQRGDYQLARKHFDTALVKAKEVKGPSGIYEQTIALGNLSFLGYLSGDLQQSMTFAEEGLSFCQVNPGQQEPRLVVACVGLNNSLGNLLIEFGAYEDSAGYLSRALKDLNGLTNENREGISLDLVLSLETKRLAAYLHNNMGVVMRGLGRLDEARKEAQLALDAAKHTNIREDLIATTRQMAITQLAQGDYVEAEKTAQNDSTPEFQAVIALHCKNYPKAIHLFEVAMKIPRKLPDKRLEYILHAGLGLAAWRSKRVDMAVLHLNKAREIMLERAQYVPDKYRVIFLQESSLWGVWVREIFHPSNY